MEVESRARSGIKTYRGEICGRVVNIVDIHRNLRLDNIAVSRTITGESYLRLSRLVPFLTHSSPACTATYTTLLSLRALLLQFIVVP